MAFEQTSPPKNQAGNAFKYSNLQIERTTTPKPKPQNDKLSFGHDTTDHMLVVSWNADSGWSSPKIQPYQNFSLPPTAKTFEFAAHIFEGLKAYYNDELDKVFLFRADRNMQRFASSAERCSLPSDFDQNELLKCIARLVDIDRDWVPRGIPHAALYIRPLLIGTEESFKVGVPNSALLYVVLGPVGSYFKKSGSGKPTRLYADPSYVRAWPGGCGAYKIGANYGPAVFVQRIAEKHGCEQALWLFGEDMQITEVGSMNIMTLWMNENGEKELITAPLETGLILPGVTRSSLLTIARQKGLFPGLKVSERTHTLPQVLQALKEGRLIEMFGCGTAAVIAPVSEIFFKGEVFTLPIAQKDENAVKLKGGKSLTDEIVSGKLLTELESIQFGRVPNHEWSLDVDKLV